MRDLIEVMLGSATRIGEVLALRRCDVDMTANPPTVTVRGTIVTQKARVYPVKRRRRPPSGTGRSPSRRSPQRSSAAARADRGRG